MTGWNLPPGCEVSDLPGCTPEDEAWSWFWENSDWAVHIYNILWEEEHFDEEYNPKINLDAIYEDDSIYSDRVNEVFNEYMSGELYYEDRRDDY